MRAEIQNSACPSKEIAAYIDGELEAALELELEIHFARCTSCANELNQQKQFLCELEYSLKKEHELDLPADFTKTVVANAESSVSGLRVERERFNAIFICAGLILFALFALGTDARSLFSGISVVFDQIVAVGSFFGHLLYSVFLGIAIILRSFAAQLRFDLAVTIVLTASLALPLMFVSRRFSRIRRA